VTCGLALGAAVHVQHGQLRSPGKELLGLPGALFMQALKCAVIPLITGSAFAGTLSLQRDAARASRAIARRTLLLYFCSMQLAVAVGILCMSLFQPGRGVSLADAACGGPSAAPPPPPPARLTGTQALLNTLGSCVPSNLFAALAGGNVLGLICVSIAAAVAVGQEGLESVEAALAAASRFNAVVSRLVNGILACTPLCIASLLASQIAAACRPLHLLSSLSAFIAVYMLGLAVHVGLVIPAALRLVGRVSPRAVYRGVAPALATVFATDSSSATLPVTLAVCKERLRLPPAIVDFVIPLGTTVNMDGTALYEATAVLFIAQTHGVALGAVGTVVVAFTATLAAVGAPAIPSAGLVTMLMVLQAVGMEQYAGDIGVLLACDWLLDRLRSMVNVAGDVACCAIVHALTERAAEREKAEAEARLGLELPQLPR